MRAAVIVLMCVFAAVVYGIVHDQITARVCVEYFTIGHPPIFPTDDPTLLGLGWGIIASWWVGLILGLGLAIASRVAGRPPQSLARPVVMLLVVMGISAAAMGLVGYLLAESESVFLLEPLASEVPPEKHSRFLADLWAHNTSYAVGFVGGLVVIVRVWRSRKVP